MCYVFTHGYCSITNSGFPHSEIPGSQLTYSSPRHIGVSAVLLRLLVPRHPPCALINLTTDGQLKKVDREAITLLDACFMFQCRSIQFSKNKLESQSLRSEPSKLNAKRQPDPKIGSDSILRKEVIQPHLPIRLPCYDFTPIICPTFGGWLP